MNKLKQSLKTYLVLLPCVYLVPPFMAKYAGLEGATNLAISTAIIVLMINFIFFPMIAKLENRSS